tara:strand:+ start:8520 stop:9188 length:669 start_codon:yes stop_codon:yes gene_type:complete
MPDGEHQVVFGGGMAFRSGESDSVFTGPRYRYGITDRLELNLLGLGYRMPLGRHSEVRVRANFLGFVTRRFEAAYSGDPREMGYKNENATFYMSGITTRTDLGNDVTAFASLSVGGYYSTLYGTNVNGGKLSGAFVYDGYGGGQLSFALPFAVSHGVEHDNREETTGSITLGGYDTSGTDAPIVSVRVTKQFDLFAAPFVRFDLQDYDITAGILSGLDWHWD